MRLLFSVTVGSKEIESGLVAVRIRGEVTRRTRPRAELGKLIGDACQGKPCRLSQRPVFVG